MKKQIIMLAMLLGASLAYAQELQLPHKVDNVELEDLYGEKVTLPMWGEKNLLIFYIDPDKHKHHGTLAGNRSHVLHRFTVQPER